MIGAFLSLPPNPIFVMTERDPSTTDLAFHHAIAQEFGPLDEKTYESARWWRNLNRGMSVLGVMIMVAVVRPSFPS